MLMLIYIILQTSLEDYVWMLPEPYDTISE